MKLTCCDCAAKADSPKDWHQYFKRAKDGTETLLGYKCPACYEKNPRFQRRCEVFSRVAGYLRPVSQWNRGKQEEFRTRKTYRT